MQVPPASLSHDVSCRPASGLFAAGYVQELNTHGGLYAALVRALEPHGAVSGSLAQPAGSQMQEAQFIPGTRDLDTHGRLPASRSEAQEARRVGRALRRDMERAGIHLAGAARARLEVLSARTHELGLVFGAPPGIPFLTLSLSRARRQSPGGSLARASGDLFCLLLMAPLREVVCESKQQGRRVSRLLALRGRADPGKGVPIRRGAADPARGGRCAPVGALLQRQHLAVPGWGRAARRADHRPGRAACGAAQRGG